MFRNEKLKFGKAVLAKSESFSSVLICSCKNMTANDMSSFRIGVRRAGAYVQMGGNRIIVKALEGSKFANLEDHLKGSNCIIFFDDSKSLIDIFNIVSSIIKSKKDKLEFKFCKLNNRECDLSLFNTLSRFKSNEQIIKDFVGSVTMPLQSAMIALNAPSASLAILLKEYYELKEGQK